MKNTFSEKGIKSPKPQEKTMSWFKKFGGTYTQVGDYLLPNLALRDDSTSKPLGKYGLMRKDYLKKNIPIGHSILANKGKLYVHCREVEEEIETQLNQVMTAFVDKTKADGLLPDKATQPIEWAAKMNSLKSQAEELVLPDLLYEFI